MALSENPITVDLGPLRRSVEERLETGSYASADEVIRAGLEALDREEAGLNEWLTRLAEDALAVGRPSIPASQVFSDLRTRRGASSSDSRS